MLSEPQNLWKLFDIPDMNSIHEFTICPNGAGVLLTNIWENSKPFKTGGRSISHFYIATYWSFLCVEDQETQCSSPLHGLTFSIAYKGHGPNIVYLPK